MKHGVNNCKDAEALGDAYDSTSRDILSRCKTARKRRLERITAFWTWGIKMLTRTRASLYRAAKISGTDTDWENTQQWKRKKKPG